MASKQKYTEQLGMNTGTAQNRLVKDILFKLINDLDINKCFQCGSTMTREDFTIEHKVPWRNESNAKDMFFDLNNISFSHFKCNIAAVRTPHKLDLTAEERIGHNRKTKKAAYKRRRDAQTPEEREEYNRKRRERRRAAKQELMEKTND